MLFIPKIDHYLKILTDDEPKDLVARNFGEYFKYTKKNNNCILNFLHTCSKLTIAIIQQGVK